MDLTRAVALTFLATFLIHLLNRKKRGLSQLPPGPPGLPLIGNALQLTEKKWLKFSMWGKEYGPVMHLNLAGQHAVVVGSAEAAAELLDRRSAIYSGRPTSIVIDILTGGYLFAFHQYNNTWKRIRKATHKALNNNVAKKYHHYEDAESLLLISQLLNKPDQLNGHLRRASNSLLLSILYGQDPIESSSDSRIKMVAEFADRITTSGSPGTHLVEIFTWMRFLPRWMCKWRRDAEEWFVKDTQMVVELVEGVENRMNEGKQRPCFISTMLEENRHEFSKIEMAWMGITLYAAGADIVSDAMAWFVLAMVLYPETQNRAKEQLDRVVGRDRMPSFGDYDSLTCVVAIVKECMRWRPVGALGVPHKLDQDDHYNGYFIPKDTICIPNIWAINHDVDVYGHDAEEFRPDRYLKGEFIRENTSGKDRGHVSYGFGRRICVGQYVANDSMFIMIARILWAFDITPWQDEKGNVLLPDPNDCVDEGLSIGPKPFRCNITPRFEGVERVLDLDTKSLGL